MHSELRRFPNLTAIDRSMLVNNVGAAIHTSGHLGGDAAEIASIARTAFVDSMHSSLWIAVGLAFCAAAVTFTQLPRQAAHKTHAGHHAPVHAGHHPHVAEVEASAAPVVSAS
jgi:beta-lactamase regulating signal transducer with metallopeptidase domain